MRSSRRLLPSVAIVSTLLGVAGLVAATATAAAATAGCHVDYAVTSSWSSGFVADLTVTNYGPDIPSWTLTFTFPAAGQQVTQFWNAKVTQNGRAVAMADPAWGGTPVGLAANAALRLGFVGSYTTINPSPTDFRLNGTLCNQGLATSTPGSPTPPITSPPVTSPPVTSPPVSPPADDLAPAVVLTSPNPLVTLPSNADTTLSADAADPDGTVSRVEFYVGGTLVGTDTTSPYSTTYHVPAGSASSYQTLSLKAVAYDDQGASATSPSRSVYTGSIIAEPYYLRANPPLVTVPEGGSTTVSISVYNSIVYSPSVAVSATSTSTGTPGVTVTPTAFDLPYAQSSAGIPVTIRAAEDDDSIGGVVAITFTGTASFNPSAVTLYVVVTDNDA